MESSIQAGSDTPGVSSVWLLRSTKLPRRPGQDNAARDHDAGIVPALAEMHET